MLWFYLFVKVGTDCHTISLCQTATVTAAARFEKRKKGGWVAVALDLMVVVVVLLSFFDHSRGI